MSKQEGSATGPSEEMKAKFREALEKKHSHGGKDVSDDQDRSNGPMGDGSRLGAVGGMTSRKTWLTMLRDRSRSSAKRAENAKNAPPANPGGAFLDRNPATSYSPRGSLPKYHRR